MPRELEVLLNSLPMRLEALGQTLGRLKLLEMLPEPLELSELLKPCLLKVPRFTKPYLGLNLAKRLV